MDWASTLSGTMQQLGSCLLASLAAEETEHYHTFKRQQQCQHA
jgi:hypothetical protein